MYYICILLKKYHLLETYKNILCHYSLGSMTLLMDKIEQKQEIIPRLFYSKLGGKISKFVQFRSKNERFLLLTGGLVDLRRSRSLFINISTSQHKLLTFIKLILLFSWNFYT
jgi:hypothetical protein